MPPSVPPSPRAIRNHPWSTLDLLRPPDRYQFPASTPTRHQASGVRGFEASKVQPRRCLREPQTWNVELAANGAERQPGTPNAEREASHGGPLAAQAIERVSMREIANRCFERMRRFMACYPGKPG